MTKKTAPDILRIAVAQLNPTVGDVAGNLAKAREARADAARQGADIVLFTELFLAGYPPEDLVLKPAFLKICEKAAQDFAADTADGGPVPTLFVAVTVTRYAVPLVSPVTVADRATPGTSAVAPPGFAVTV